MTLGIIITVAFMFPLLLRPVLHDKFIESTEETRQAKKTFFLEFTLCLVAGLIISAITFFLYHLPAISLGSILIGSIIAGFFIGLDSSLAREKIVILRATASNADSPLPQKFFPMTRKFTLIAIITSVFFAIVLILVFVRDVEWLVGISQNQQSIHEAQLSVTYEIFFIMAILMALITNLIISYSANLKLLFNNQTWTLEQVSKGNLHAKVPIASHDEFGFIAGHTNEMIDGLRHRFELVSSLKLAEEVQQNLLPDASPNIERLDISGISIYCDQTGGDYYDYFPLPDNKLGIVVADACGHGVGAAMLMTSVRAFLTSVIREYRNPPQLLQELNNFVTRDCAKSGRFTSMFFMAIDTQTKELEWVRAGHEPAKLFRATDKTFTRLDGAGMVLGIDESYPYTSNNTSALHMGDIILIGTDGIGETRNDDGKTFGQKRLENIISTVAIKSAEEIRNTIVREVEQFRGNFAQEDDITLVVVKSS